MLNKMEEKFENSIPQQAFKKVSKGTGGSWLFKRR
jgi:hypothetical protein